MSEDKPHVQQARNELENALAHGNGERVKAARKALAAAGVEQAAQARRSAATTTEDGEQEQRSTPPKGRSRKPQQTTEQARRAYAAADSETAEPDPAEQPRRKPGERLNLG